MSSSRWLRASGQPAKIMGVLNCTPDSFSDGGRFVSGHLDTDAALDHALTMQRQGADIIDVGGESTRPGAEPVAGKQELARVIPVIQALAARDIPISIDTTKAEVMRQAIRAGATLVNDVSALTFDAQALETIADLGVPVVLMHALGDPKTMQDNPVYEDVQLDVFDYLEARLEACVRAGIARDKIIVDPGIGFGKTLEHNLDLIRGLSLLHGLGVPILFGASRKRFIGTLTGVETSGERVSGSVGAALAAVAQGAQIVRVHDVAATRQALEVWCATHG